MLSEWSALYYLVMAATEGAAELSGWVMYIVWPRRQFRSEAASRPFPRLKTQLGPVNLERTY